MADANQRIDPALVQSILGRLAGLQQGPSPAGSRFTQLAGGGGGPGPGGGAAPNLMQLAGNSGRLAAVQQQVAALPGGGGEFGKALHEEISRLIQAMTVTKAALGSPAALAQLQQEHESRQAAAREEADARAAAGARKLRTERIQELKGHVGGAFETQGPAQAAHVAGAVKTAGQLAGGPLGGAIGAVGKFAEALMGAVGRVQRWNESLRTADFQFAQFSAGMAHVQAESQMARIQIAMQRGERRAPSAQARERSAVAAESKWAPILDNFSIFMNRVMAILNKILEWIADFLTWLGLGRGEPPRPPQNLGAAFADIGAEGWGSVYGAPLWSVP